MSSENIERKNPLRISWNMMRFSLPVICVEAALLVAAVALVSVFIMISSGIDPEYAWGYMALGSSIFAILASMWTMLVLLRR